MQVTVVVPVLNEAKSIEILLKSLKNQTLSPTEVVIVDGGSTDETVGIIKKWQSQSKWKLTLIEEKGANIARARNIGIAHAHTEVVALTDAGCTPKENWLQLLTTPFHEDPKTEVVAGFYDPKPKNWFENILADFTCVREWNFNADTYLPSSRSLALTKKIWQKAGKYPEHLERCEDLVFAENLKEEAKHWVVKKEAKVIWHQPKNLSQLSEKVYGYASGDLEAKYERHVSKIHAAKWRILALLVVAVPLLFLSNPFLRVFGIGIIALYILGTWAKHPRMLLNPSAFFILPIVQLTVDFALVQALIYQKLSSQYK
jgi:glycosyltransferase involved in cell wall biosynthesis